MVLKTSLVRIIASVLLIGGPLVIAPPWRHVDPIDHAFWTHRFGEFDRHAFFWRPPFSREVAAEPRLTLPVQFDRARFARELIVGTVVAFAFLRLMGVPAAASTLHGIPRRPPLGRIAPVLALLLPIPPVGPLAFSSWESLTDSNHGVPFILPMLLYWGLLTAFTYGALRLGWFGWCKRRSARGAF